MSETAEAPRLDVWLAHRRGITRHAARTLIDAGLVRVRGRPGRAGQRVHDDDASAIDVLPAPPPTVVAHADAPDLTVVAEDEWLAVIDKPAGVVVHRGAGHHTGTLADALLQRGTSWSLLGGSDRPGIVHRLDKDTSGLLVVAKTEAAHRALAQQLRDRSLGRTYWALVHGGFRESSGTIDAPIGRDPRNRKRMAVLTGGRDSISDFRVVESLGDASLLEVSLRSGRTHQIRVHMAHIRHPLVGDVLYGRADPVLHRPALHAMRLRFLHPGDGTERLYESEPPQELQAALQRFRTRGR
ncbi:MAG: RluA family pseudouridine synthase [Candidatus Dormibacteraeota bacterium]|nr:RluA family pseudouridine synthase [Candidatus Dormibacteraeota bacterium]